MATDSLNAQRLQRPSRTTLPQVFWLTAQAAFVLGVIAWQSAVNTDAMKLFCTDADGIQLAMSASLLLVANFTCSLGGFWLLNRLNREGQGSLRQMLLGLLCCASLLFFYLPALFTLLVGPAAIHIRTLMLEP